jgi:hypothetical protein
LQAGDVKLGKVFANDHQNVIPIFQRPYVWDEADNWDPLWRDIRKAAEEIEVELTAGSVSQAPPTYFLGAVVIQQRHKHPQRLDSSHIIDGQQRMTTLQVLLAASRAVAAALGQSKTAARFSALVENRSETIHDEFPDDRYKVWPLPQDKEAFLWAVRRPADEGSPPDQEHRLVRARLWFEMTISAWVKEVDQPHQRLEHLLFALQDRMQLVEINLDPSDDPQVIFEALNHRGVRLDAADLVKNLLFQTLDKQGDATEAESLLTKYWLHLDGKHWRGRTTTGRIKRVKIDLLLSYWLTIRKREEVLVDHLFADFKIWISDTGARASEVIKQLKHYADVYETLESLPRTDPTGRLIESMRATGTNTPWPILLYLNANPKVPRDQRTKAAEAVESYLMRRGVAGLTSSDYNRLFVLVAKEACEAEPSSAGDAVVSTLVAQTADSRNWPTDEEFCHALLAPGLYDRMYRARLKALLVGIENHLRSDKTVAAGTLAPGDPKLNIEHVMPQKWQANWPLPPAASDDDISRREAHLHQLGNLTLATTKLNPSLSNKAWLEKKPILQSHSLVRLTTASIFAAPGGSASHWSSDTWSSDWDERRIEIRGAWLAEQALTIWKKSTPAGTK